MSEQNDPRITSFQSRNEHPQPISIPFSRMRVAPMKSFDPAIPAGQQDQYHMYTHIGRNAYQNYGKAA